MVMTWVGEEFPDLAADLTDAQFRLHVEALCWANRMTSDCRVAKRDLRRFAFAGDYDEAAEQLVQAGFWIDHGDHWQLALGAEWQETSQQVEARRLKNRRATWHRRGRHDICIPGRCPHAVSSDDSAADSADVSSSSLGRAGLGRDRSSLDEQPQRALNGIGKVVAFSRSADQPDGAA